ncbi:hypothetical protein [Massilia sp. BSC265]|uniref:hypothetical protein n=1 Tax=Massilia sp. BSC265 TaxID=1549812 RepID=UPI00068BB385|nr:hypothetical protein [Massilia sp. BSC265]
MNNVRIKIQAEGSAASGGLPLQFATLVRHGVVAFALACTAAGAVAAGQDRSPRRDEMHQQGMRDRYDARAQDPRYDQRAYEMREEARMRQEEAMRDSMREEGGRRMRMTPDERSELKRQINEANRDLPPNLRRR